MKNVLFGSIADRERDGRLDYLEQSMDIPAFVRRSSFLPSQREEAIAELAKLGIRVDDTIFTDLSGVLDEFDFAY